MGNMFHNFSGLRIYLQGLVVAFCLCLYGCAAPNSAPPTSSLVPATGGGATFQVHEYALVEESKDNPDHVQFEQRVPAAVESHQSGWPFSNTEDLLETANQALAPFGYFLEGNPTPPFSGYSLYHDKKLIQRDIARFDPVALKNNESDPGAMDFFLSFETMDGEKMVADMAGVHSSKAEEQSAGRLGTDYLNQKMAFAGGTGSDVYIFAGSGLREEKTQSVIQGISQINGNIGGFGIQMINGKTFLFYSRGDLIHLNYAGRDLPYTYDRVVHDNKDETAIFNPGGNGKILWFYALRDGLWYYVEAGIFN